MCTALLDIVFLKLLAKDKSAFGLLLWLLLDNGDGLLLNLLLLDVLDFSLIAR